MPKKLIEVALPLEAINAESAREKSIRHGHPSTLHLWWSRKPTATARAVIWSSLVDDPSEHPEQFPTEEEQNQERQRLFGILEKLVKWENSNNQAVLDAAKAEILRSTGNNPPPLLDPFAGGGAIPLEAQRLGLEAHAHDLNPVAVMINKAMIEIPPKFAGQSPVNPEARAQFDGDGGWSDAKGLAEDVRYYGDWIKQQAFKKIGHLYPKVKVPADQGGGEATVIAWIWARTVKCPNPACGCEMPLVSSFVLSKKKGKEAWIEPIYSEGKISFTVKKGPFPKYAEVGTKYINDKGKGKKATFCCPICQSGIVDGAYADIQAEKGMMGAVPMAVVADRGRGRIYLSIDDIEMSALEEQIQNYYLANDIDNQVPHAQCRGTFASNAQGRYYGFHEFKDYFTKRQLITLITFSKLISEVRKEIEQAALSTGISNNHLALCEGGVGARAYGEAVSVYLAFVVNKLADYNSRLCSWHNTGEKIRNTFSLQGISMVWTCAEGNPFCSFSGSYGNMLEWVVKSLAEFPACKAGWAKQFDAQSDCLLRNVMVSCDPPYYNNVDYSDLSDFFYVWMRQVLKDIYPNLFRTVLVPKEEELVAIPYRFNGSTEKAKDFFENGMLHSCKQIYKYARDDIPVTIYYAYKQSDTDSSEEKLGTSSTGWETMLSAVIRAGLSITGTWPIRTEMTSRTGAHYANSLASSIALVCRKRPADAPTVTRRSFIAELKRELRPALQKLQRSNIAPVDLAQSAIGPGMGVYSKYSKVLEADGTPMTVRSALQIINQELDVYFNEQDGELDQNSRFCVDLYMQNAFNDIRFGDADTLARAKNTSVAALVAKGVLYAQKGSVHLLTREELPKKVDEQEETIWLLCQQLTQAMATGGVAACGQIVVNMMGSNAERAKDLAYRLYTVAERKGWTQEAYAYNALVIAWPEVQAYAAALQASKPEQMSLF